MNNHPLVSPQQIASFRREGFVVIDDLLTESELEKFAAAVDRAVADRKRNDTRALAEKSLYEQSFTQCINLWEDHPDVSPLTFHAKISAVAGDNARAFLAAMLQGVQAVVGQFRRIRMAINAKYAAIVFGMVLHSHCNQTG